MHKPGTADNTMDEVRAAYLQEIARQTTVMELEMLVASCHVIMCSCCGSHVLQRVLTKEGNLEVGAGGAKHLAWEW